MKHNLIIAIDGFSSTGKSSLSKIIAQKLHYTHIDSGAMYRAVTWYAIEHHLFDDFGNVLLDELSKQIHSIQIEFRRNPETHKNETFVNGQRVEAEIRSMQVSNKVSAIAALKVVRDYCVFLQRAIAKNGGIVMDGRDIGTVVFPDADYKFFITASPEVRAKRRFLEYQQSGRTVDYDEVLANVVERDRIDSTREIAPVKPAEDAIIIDNSELNLDETVEKVMSFLV
ncbi:(d)CMP kinase [Vaginella massiliensis]|uniref:(d)CMP kinase n=1 Tax=Vaginella massiliensis TaxID=1816680 RepID=UPI000837DCA3|nr:(d)CMP kinase [Vaginella massiliensis]